MDKKSEKHLQNLDRKLQRLLTDLRRYSDAKLNEQPNETAWSALQIMQHLMRAEAGAIAYVQKKLSFNPDLPKANVLSGLRSSMLNIALSVPLKMKAPDGVSDEHLATNLTFWDVAKSWRQQRKELEAYLRELPEHLYQTDLYKHPMTGKMTLAGMLSFFNTHVDRHTRQIYRTLKKVDAVAQV